MLLFPLLTLTALASAQLTLPVEPTFVEDLPTTSNTINFSGLRPDTGAGTDTPATTPTGTTTSKEVLGGILTLTGENSDLLTSTSQAGGASEEGTSTSAQQTTSTTGDASEETGQGDEGAGSIMSGRTAATVAGLLALVAAMLA